VPDRFVAESLLDAFPAGPGRVLIARAEAARDVLPEGLVAKGYEVVVLPVYRTVAAPPDVDTLSRLRGTGGAVDAVAFTSSSTVDNLCSAVGGPLPDPQPHVVSIGPVTSATARERGLRVDAEADPHSIDGLVEAVVRLLSK
jgi:uroporphyrinogen-III synthase